MRPDCEAVLHAPLRLSSIVIHGEPTYLVRSDREGVAAMIDDLEEVRDHYRAAGLTDRLKTALAPFGPEQQRLSPLRWSISQGG